MRVEATSFFQEKAGGDGRAVAGPFEVIEVSGLKGYRGSLEGMTGPLGQALLADVAMVFDGVERYVLDCQYEPVSAETMRAA